ncbi:hypothetical protein BH10ACT9_BH10ACT9_17270 [soil metagenome]
MGKKMDAARRPVPSEFASRRPRQHGAHRLYAILRTAIKFGEIDVRSPLDERLIGTELAFSRAEVREVLRLLSDEGFLSRKVSVGTFVATTSVAVDLFDFVPLDPNVRVTRRQTDKFVLGSGGLLAIKLGGEAQQVVLTEHELMMDGDLVAINTAFSATGAKHGLSKFDEIEHQQDLEVQFPDEYGTAYGGMEVSVDSRVADRHLADVLQVQPGAAILMREQMMYDTDGNVWEYSLSQWRADRVVFSSRRSAGRRLLAADPRT